ncbi:MAG TPA: peptidyl-prolyl cis-trans isomerase [Elusimicrobiota bacterium]|jgi:foldase protein PrsA|nr:peptidyl-prolyl cis-trans isomerase [Elusimicrobiota bacterium]
MSANKILTAACAIFMAAPLWAQGEKEVVLTVDGTPVTQAQVSAFAVKNYGNAALGDLVNKILVDKAMKDYHVRPDTREIDARIKNIQKQFKDQKTFEARLAATGSSLAALRSQIEDQVMREDLVKKADKISISDDEVRKYFDAHKGTLGVPEAVRVSDIMVASENSANDLLVALKSGADFSKVAAEVSLDNATKNQGGDMGFIPRGMLQPQIEKAVFSAKVGDVVGPLRLPNGYFILKVVSFRQAKPAAYKEVSARLKNALLADKIGKAWPQFLQELRQKAKIVPNKALIKKTP